MSNTDKLITQKIKELVDLVRENCPLNSVTFNLFVNDSEYEVEYKYRDAKTLKRNGISMRDLGGNWIEERN